MPQHFAILLPFLSGCMAARAVAPDTGDASPLCPASSGFTAVGTVWDYNFAVLAMEGWERSELVSIDTSSGEVQVDTTGTHTGGGFRYDFERSEVFGCSEEGLSILRWTKAWNMTVGASSLYGSNDVTLDGGAQILLPDADMAEPTASWDAASFLYAVNADGEVTSGPVDWSFRREPTETLSLLGTAIEAIPVSYYGTLYGTTWTVPWIWYAEDIGIVKRGGLTLDSYSLGSGALME